MPRAAAASRHSPSLGLNSQAALQAVPALCTLPFPGWALAKTCAQGCPWQEGNGAWWRVTSSRACSCLLQGGSPSVPWPFGGMNPRVDTEHGAQEGGQCCLRSLGDPQSQRPTEQGARSVGSFSEGQELGPGPPMPRVGVLPKQGVRGLCGSRHLGVGCERVGCWQRRRAAGTTGAVAGAPVPSTPVSTTREGWALLEHSWSTGCAWRLGHKG